MPVVGENLPDARLSRHRATPAAPSSMTFSPDSHRALMRKFFRRTVGSLVFLGLILFGAAGTLAWPEAWIYLALAAAMSFAGGLWLARHDPALLAERLGSLIQRDQKPWDKAVMAVMLALWVGWLALMGLDAERYHWSEVPLGLQVLGLVLIGLGSYVIWLTLRANSFAAPVIKIQTERGHRVATTGPYAYVRHPMYAGALLFIAGVPLLLGSWWGLAAGPVLAVLIAFRAVLEERTLKAELEGYADYAGRVRFRLVPYLW
jgi:protein-S-isoprenylcysteine O-methyltransferase Ste14